MKLTPEHNTRLIHQFLYFRASQPVCRELFPRVNFTNILLESFTCTDLKRAKKTDSLTVLFTLLGSAYVKAEHKMFVKLVPGVSPKI